MMTPGQIKTLSEMGVLKPDQVTRLSQMPSPDASPELRNQWEAENELASDDAKRKLDYLVASRGKAAEPFTQSTRLDLIKKAQEIALNKKAAANAEAQKPQPPSEAELELAARDAGLPFDASKISTPTDLVPTESPKAANPLGSMFSAFDKEKKANTDLAKIGSDQAKAESSYLKTMYDEAQKIDDDNNDKELYRQTKLNEQMSLLNTKLNDYAKTPTLKERFANKTTGGKILAGIALFLGAAPNGGTQNTALQAMQAAVDADLEKQKVGVEGARSMYKDLLQTFGDERQADAATKLAFLNTAQIQLNQIAAKYKGETVSKNAELLNAKIDEQKQALSLSFQQASTSKLQSADDVTNYIFTNIPKELQGKALEEKASLDKIEQTNQAINRSYKELEGVGFIAGHTPKTDARTKLLSQNAVIASIVQDSASGKFSEAYIKNMIRPFQVEPSDSVSEIRIKAQRLKDFVKANSKPLSLLKGMEGKTDMGFTPYKK